MWFLRHLDRLDVEMAAVEALRKEGWIKRALWQVVPDDGSLRLEIDFQAGGALRKGWLVYHLVMIPMLPVLMQATKTARTTMAEWFDRYPPGYPWTVASDYCIGDVNKPNDVFSFVIIAPHDTAENICRYIAGAAPKDLKNTKDIPLGLVQYLTCEVPVTFSISFVLKREEALLRAHLDVENMLEFVPGAIAYLEYRLREYPAERTVEFHEETVKRFKAFGRELESKNLNAKLARQMHLAAAASATVFNSLNLARQPKAIRWISDRDALIARHDAVVYDLTYVYYMLQAEMHAMRELEAGRTVPTTQANLGFEIPEQTGKHRYDEIVRLPDYLAGTLADLNSETMRAKRFDWVEISKRFACDRTTAWRRWKRDMQVVADLLNRQAQSPKK